MSASRGDASGLRPIILAAGLGTRLRPRTNYLPKPLLPVAGRPLLWYALRVARGAGVLEPIVVLDYLADQIRAFFDGAGLKFCDLPQRTMAQAVVEVAEGDSADAFLGMSSDVLVPGRAVERILGLYRSSGGKDSVLFVRLPKPGHKKWEFCVSEGRLCDIRVRETKTDFERVLLILNKKSLEAVKRALPSPIREGCVPPEFVAYQTGWILLMKAMLSLGIHVAAEVVDIPVCNINVADDFGPAEEFVAREMSG